MNCAVTAVRKRAFLFEIKGIHELKVVPRFFILWITRHTPMMPVTLVSFLTCNRKYGTAVRGKVWEAK
jgi:hypothetical protein